MNLFNAYLKRATIVLSIASAFLLSSVNALSYCSSSGNNTNYEWIQSVSINGYQNNSGSNGGYGDFTSQQIFLSVGDNPITLIPGFGSSSYMERWKVWIDFNGDNTYSESEVVYNGSSSSSLSGSISVPTSASAGYTGMRVSMRYGSTPSSCGSFSYGEVEDYQVYLDTTDTVSPTVTATTPENSATDVALNTIITVQLSEAIDPLSVNGSSLVLLQNGAPIQGNVSGSGDTITFTPNNLLQYSTQYTAVLYAGGVSDLAGNPLLQDTQWSFITTAPDITAPVVEFTSPQDGESDVSTNFVIQAHFSEAMDPNTLNASSFIITDGVNPVSGTISYGNDTVQFYPDQNLDYLTTYYATITTEAEDVAGNALATDYQWSFTTREFQQAYCSSYSNNTNYMWISSVKVGSHTWSTASQPATGYGDATSTVFNLSRYGWNSSVFTPGYSNYAYTTYWRVFIDWDHDGTFSAAEVAFEGSGNSALNGSLEVPAGALGGNTRMRVSMQYASYPSACATLSYGYVVDFRVNVPDLPTDTTPPTVTGTDPADYDSGISIGSSVSADFSEALNEATIDSSAMTVSDGTANVSGTLSYDSLNDRIVFTPSTPLNYNTMYTATVWPVIEDLAGNNLTSQLSWSFTTEIQIDPGYSLSGTVSLDGVGMGSVTLDMVNDDTGEDFSTTTLNNGNYVFSEIPDGSYTITPSRAGYDFAPENLGVVVQGGAVLDLDFTATAVIGALVNGDFETGDLSGFSSYTTSSGHVISDVVVFDTNNDGIATQSAKFNVGTNGTNIGTQHGGGIYQNVTLVDGDLSFSMDIASTANTNNGDGGLVQVFFDGQLMTNHDFESISAGTNEYASLSFYMPSVAAGVHEIRIELTRAYGTTSVANYIDDLLLTGSSTSE